MTGMETIRTEQDASGGSGVSVPGPRSGGGWRTRLHHPIHPGGGGQSGGGRTFAGEPMRRLLLVSLALACIAMTVVFIAVARGPQISITDEPAHAGYLYEVAHGHLPYKGQLVPEEIRYEWYCHNQQVSTGAAHCTGFDASTFQTSAQVYTFGDPPVYYAVTGVLDRGISALLPGSHHFIDVGRALGALWLFAAMIVLYLAARKFRVGWKYAFAAAALVPLCPGILAASSQITSDAAAAFCGALGLYVLARILIDKNMGLVVPFLATVFTTGTKVLNGMPLLVVGGVTFFIAAGTLYRDRANRRAAIRPLLVTAAIGFGFVLTYVGWTVFQNHRGSANWVNPNLGNGSPVSGSPAGELLSNLFGTFTNLTTAYWLPASINGETIVIWATLLCVVLAAAPLIVMTASRARSWGWTLGVSTFAGITAVALVVEAQVYTANHEYFVNVSPRYALTFLPWAILCVAVVAGRRRLLKSSYAFVSLGLIVLLLAETGLFTLGPALVSNASYLVG